MQVQLVAELISREQQIRYQHTLMPKPQDHSQELEIKNQQLESEKSFKNKFLANVSHDLITPMWGFKIFLSFLEIIC